MALSTVSVSESQTPLPEDKAGLVTGYADRKGHPVSRSKSGGWKSASFILGAVSIERFAYYGIETNLVNYLTGFLGESVATAAANVNLWIGLNWFLPISGAFLADSFLGRYGTVVLTSVVDIMGLGSLTLLAIVQIWKSKGTSKTRAIAAGCSDTVLKILFYISLYIVTIAQGHRPCAQALGADQFDGNDPQERKAKTSFFNWWFTGICSGSLIAHFIINYVQEHINWGLGFGILCLSMIFSLVLFLLGTPRYRFAVRRRSDVEESPHDSSRQQSFEESLHNTVSPTPASTHCDGNSQNLNITNAPENSKGDAVLVSCYSNWIRKSKRVARLFKIWTPCLVYAIAYAQGSTFFTKQATTVNRSIGPNLEIPAASVRTFLPLTIVIFTPIYERVLIPVSRTLMKQAPGITMLQRIGTGLSMCGMTMVVAALIEKKRLKIAQEHGLADGGAIPNAVVPMSFWWLVPQYVMFGIADVFAQVGMQEFFYEQVPREMRSVGLSLYLSVIGVGNLLSSFLISIVEKATSSANGGGDGWFTDNLNCAHVDHFYWLMAAIVGVGFVFFVMFAKSYSYRD